MGVSLLVVAMLATSSVGQSIRQETIDTQNEAFQRWWGTEFSWKFEDLPTEATVAAERVPYSGYIYPDNRGGTVNALRKYDRAFHNGRLQATSHEQWDTTAFRKPTQQAVRGGLFGRVYYRTVYATPSWYGHCNGWSAAAIRHAEPRRSVRRNGVEFTPADIKALLAEIYMYNDTLMLDGDGSSINPGVLHAVVSNWLGRGLHPVAIEADPGEEKWNYPMYAYGTNSARRGNRVEVRLSVYYAMSSNGEFQESPRIRRARHFHYDLHLNDDGEIVGGSYYRDSSSIDMLWVPLSPKQSGQPGNERGNPYVDVDEVLAIWRDSVDEDVRRRWAIVDPPLQDRLFASEQVAENQLTPMPEQSVAAEESDSQDQVAAADESTTAEPQPVAAEQPDATAESATDAELATTDAGSSDDALNTNGETDATSESDAAPESDTEDSGDASAEAEPNSEAPSEAPAPSEAEGPNDGASDAGGAPGTDSSEPATGEPATGEQSAN